MGEPQYLIDTNIIIDYLGRNLPANGTNFMDPIIDAVPNISVITKIEVLGFTAPPEYHNILSDFMNDASIMDLSEDVVNECIALRKAYKIKLPDAIIAAIALVHGLFIITRNTKDFIKVKGLSTVNPWDK